MANRRNFIDDILSNTPPDQPPVSEEELLQIAEYIMSGEGVQNEPSRGIASRILNLPDDGGEFGIDYETQKEIERQKNWMTRDYSPEESVGNPLSLFMPLASVGAFPGMAVTMAGETLNDLAPLATATAPRFLAESATDLGKQIGNSPRLDQQLLGRAMGLPEDLIRLLDKGAGAERGITDALGNVPVLGGAMRGMTNSPHEGDVRGSTSNARGFGRILELSEEVNKDGGNLLEAGRKARSAQSIPGLSAGLDTVANMILPAAPGLTSGGLQGVRALSDVPSTFILSGMKDIVAKGGREAVERLKSMAPENIRVKLENGIRLTPPEEEAFAAATKDAYIASRGGRAPTPEPSTSITVPPHEVVPNPPRPVSANAVGEFMDDPKNFDRTNRANTPQFDYRNEIPDEVPVQRTPIENYLISKNQDPDKVLPALVSRYMADNGIDEGTAIQRLNEIAAKQFGAEGALPPRNPYPNRPDIGSPEDIAAIQARELEEAVAKKAEAERPIAEAEARMKANQEKAIAQREADIRAGKNVEDDYVTKEAWRRIGMDREAFEGLNPQLRNSARPVQYDTTSDYQSVIDEAVERLDEFNYKVDFTPDGDVKVTRKEGFEPRGDATIWRDRLNAAIKGRKGEETQIPSVPGKGETYVREGVEDIGTSTPYYAKDSDVSDILRARNAEKKKFTGPSGENWAERNGNAKYFSDEEVKEYNTLIDEKGKKGWGGDKKRRLNELEKKGQTAYKKEHATASVERASEIIENKRQGSAWADAANFASSVAGSPRAFQSTLDVSYALRQGGFLKFGHPQAYGKALGNSLHAFGSDDYAKKVMKEIAEDATEVTVGGKVYKVHELAKGILTDTAADADSFAKSSEDLVNAGLISELPGIKNANNAFAVFGNKFRYDILKKRVQEWADSGMTEAKFLQNVETAKHWLNAGTGRGDAPQWLLNTMFKNKDAANAAYRALVHTMYSPRLTSSRFELAAMAAQSLISNKAVHGVTSRIPGLNKIVQPSEVADMILKDAFVGYTDMAATLGLMKWVKSVNKNMDIDVEDDPKSDRFGQVRFGENWYDLSIGHGDLFSIMAQVQSGKKIDPITRSIDNVDIAKVITDYFRKKVSPELSMYRELGTDLPLQTGKDAIGRPGARIGNITKGQPLLYNSGDNRDQTGEKIAQLYSPLGVQQFTEVAETFGEKPQLGGMTWLDAIGTRLGGIAKVTKEHPGNMLGAVGADFVGVGSQVYEPTSAASVVLKAVQDAGYKTKDGGLPVRKDEIAFDREGNPVRPDDVWNQTAQKVKPEIDAKKLQSGYAESPVRKMEREALDAEKKAEMDAHTKYYYYTRGQIPKEAFDKSLQDFVKLTQDNNRKIREAKEKDEDYQSFLKTVKTREFPDDRYQEAMKKFFQYSDEAKKLEGDAKDAVYDEQRAFRANLPEEISKWLDGELEDGMTQLEKDYYKDLSVIKKWDKVKDRLEKESPIIGKYYAIQDMLFDTKSPPTAAQKKSLEAQRDALVKTPQMKAYFDMRVKWMKENSDVYEAGRFWRPDSFNYLEPRQRTSSTSNRSTPRAQTPAQRLSNSWRNIPTTF